MNPHFEAYAAAHGRSPDDQLTHDEQEYPGGKMAGFICWMAEQQAQFRKVHSEAIIGLHIKDQTAWRMWLSRPNQTTDETNEVH